MFYKLKGTVYFTGELAETFSPANLDANSRSSLSSNSFTIGSFELDCETDICNLRCNSERGNFSGWFS